MDYDDALAMYFGLHKLACRTGLTSGERRDYIALESIFELNSQLEEPSNKITPDRLDKIESLAKRVLKV